MQGKQSPRRALVLSGGGARGAYEAGVATALFERESFEIVCGTSIGAINAALAAQDATGKLLAIWRGVPERAVIRGVTPFEEFRTIFRRRPRGSHTVRELAVDLARAIGALRYARPKRLRQLTHVLDHAPLVALLASVLDYAELRRTLIVGVTNLTRARPEAFYAFPPGDAAFESVFAAQESTSVRLTSENYLASILASAAIPLAFPKVSMSDRDGVTCDYVDGGVGNNTPIRQAIDAGADEITVVIANHIALRDRNMPIDQLGLIALVAQDIIQQQLLELDLKLTRRVNEGVLCGAAPGKRFVHIRTIGPTVAIPLPILGFADVETIDRAFHQGLLDGRGACDARGLNRLFSNDPTARSVHAGDEIFRVGETGQDMFVLIEGEVDLTFRDRVIASFSAGDVFGELAILGAGPRRVTAVAKSEARIVPVDRSRFVYLVQYAPSFAITVLRSMTALLESMADRLASLPADALDGRGPSSDMTANVDILHDDASIQSFAAGDVIFSEGDASTGMFVVLEGQVEIRAEATGTIQSARKGGVFGELALCDRAPRRATAKAVTDARLALIDLLAFTSLVQNNPNFAIDMMRVMAARLLGQADAMSR